MAVEAISAAQGTGTVTKEATDFFEKIKNDVELFSAIDTNKDGKIEQNELAEFDYNGYLKIKNTQQQTESVPTEQTKNEEAPKDSKAQNIITGLIEGLLGAFVLRSSGKFAQGAREIAYMTGRPMNAALPTLFAITTAILGGYFMVDGIGGIFFKDKKEK